MLFRSTPVRKYILADTPGHAEFTRNMITGASSADVAMLLVDARHGVVEQTRRHAYITQLLRMPHVLVCINKMDLVDFNENIFLEIKNEVEKLFANVGHGIQRHYVPISALHGDNVVESSNRIPWYTSDSLMQTLDSIEIETNRSKHPFRLPVQYLLADKLVVMGSVSSGKIKIGDEILNTRSKLFYRVESILSAGENRQFAESAESVAIGLNTFVDIERGDVFCLQNELPSIANKLNVTICWLSEASYVSGMNLIFRQAHSETSCYIHQVLNKIDISTQEYIMDNDSIEMNDIVNLEITTSANVVFDTYLENHISGCFVFIHPKNFATVAAGFIN